MPKTPEKIEKEDGTIEWMLDGELHREDGPAVEKPGSGLNMASSTAKTALPWNIMMVAKSGGKTAS